MSMNVCFQCERDIGTKLVCTFSILRYRFFYIFIFLDQVSLWPTERRIANQQRGGKERERESGGAKNEYMGRNGFVTLVYVCVCV